MLNLELELHGTACRLSRGEKSGVGHFPSSTADPASCSSCLDRTRTKQGPRVPTIARHESNRAQCERYRGTWGARDCADVYGRRCRTHEVPASALAALPCRRLRNTPSKCQRKQRKRWKVLEGGGNSGPLVGWISWPNPLSSRFGNAFWGARIFILRGLAANQASA